VLVALADDESRPVSERVADRLRSRGISCEVAPSAQKYGRQIRYAERRGIPFVWFPATETGASDQVKDIRSGDQVDADTATWTPPEGDLRPTIVTSTDDPEENTQ
jgi:histidyl-tRNA synthetase